MNEEYKAETRKRTEVMLACLEGKKIEGRTRVTDGGWHPCPTPVWDWFRVDYRVKPEPRHVYAEAVINGMFTGYVFFPGPDVPMPAARPGHVLVKLVEVLK